MMIILIHLGDRDDVLSYKIATIVGVTLAVMCLLTLIAVISCALFFLYKKKQKGIRTLVVEPLVIVNILRKVHGMFDLNTTDAVRGIYHKMPTNC